MINKNIGIGAIALAFSVASFGASAQGWEFTEGNFLSANVNFSTDYVFRGTSQTNGGPAVQGGFDWTNTDYSIYAGVWGSNVDSSTGTALYTDEVTGAHALSVEGLERQLTDAGVDLDVDENMNGVSDYLEDNTMVTTLTPTGFDGASAEMDFYLGWAPTVETGYGAWNFDFGYTRYQYFGTDSDEVNTDEFYGGIEFDWNGDFQVGYKAHYSDDYFALGEAWYHSFGMNASLDRIIKDAPGFSLYARYGITDYTDDRARYGLTSNADGRLVSVVPDEGDYNDYSVGVRYENRGWFADLAWVDRTDKEDCVEAFTCRSKALFTVGREF